jgi:hypothetical protein
MSIEYDKMPQVRISAEHRKRLAMVAESLPTKPTISSILAGALDYLIRNDLLVTAVTTPIEPLSAKSNACDKLQR